MKKILLTMLCALALAGCTGANTSLNTLQVSGVEEAFPADYQARARRHLGEQAMAGVQISYPRTVVGETAFSARRWYVCLAGLAPPGAPPSSAKPVLEAAIDLVRPEADLGVYHTILILRPSGSTTAITGFDAPLCAGSRYEPLAAG